MAQLMTALIGTGFLVMLVAILWAILFALLGGYGFPAPPRPLLHEHDGEHANEASPPM